MISFFLRPNAARVTATRSVPEKVSLGELAALTVITVLKGPRAHVSRVCVTYISATAAPVASEHNLTRYVGVVLTCLA